MGGLIVKRTIGLLLASTLLAGTAYAMEPTELVGQQLSAEEFAALVEAAKAANPPKSGDGYVFGFANLARNAPFFLNTEEGILRNGEAAGVEILVTDNALDGSTALQNAESYIRRNVDYVIEFQTDANFAPTIMTKFNDAGIKVIAIDIPMPGSTFFGANNPRSGFMGGAYLAQAASAKWSPEEIANGYLVVGELPQSGAIPAMRTKGQIGGFLAENPDFPEDRIIRLDTKGTLEEAFRVMSDAIGRIPAGSPIMGLAINDQSIIGMLRAVNQAGRGEEALFVGMGADEIDTLVSEPNFLASVGYFPENYGNYIVPMALMELGGQELPPAVLVTHEMVTKANVCEFYTDKTCAGEAMDYTFPQEAFVTFLGGLSEDPELADYKTLIPNE